MILALLFAILLVLIFVGIPVLLAIGLVALLGIHLTDGVDPFEFPKRMFTFLNSFGLLALPYFILAGELMSRGGMGKRMIGFAEALVGHLRAGLGQASVLACMVFANVSGSAAASTAAIGSVLIPSMSRRGYKPGFSASLLACAGIIGSIIPPSMVMIVYGSMAGVSIEGLFIAGILPGLLITAVLMATIRLHALLPAFPELRATTGRLRPRAVVRAAGRVWTALLAPLIILGGILGGIFTATEAGVVACVYAFVVSMFVYRSVRWIDLPGLLVRAAVTTTLVVGIISVAGALGFVMSNLRFDEHVRELLLGLSTNRLVVLAALLLVMMLLTMFIESLAVLIVLVPVIVEIARTFGFDPLHFGMLIVMATQIGAVTPPVAVGLFVATSIAGTTYDQTLRYCWPFILALLATLVAAFFIPPLATWLPRILLAG